MKEKNTLNLSENSTTQMLEAYIKPRRMRQHYKIDSKNVNLHQCHVRGMPQPDLFKTSHGGMEYLLDMFSTSCRLLHHSTQIKRRENHRVLPLSKTYEPKIPYEWLGRESILECNGHKQKHKTYPMPSDASKYSTEEDKIIKDEFGGENLLKFTKARPVIFHDGSILAYQPYYQKPSSLIESKNTYLIAQLPVFSTSRLDLADYILQKIKQKSRLAIFFVNTNFVVKCRLIRDDLIKRSSIFVNDGIGMDIAAMLLYRRRFHENLNGTDFLPFLFQRSNYPLRVFLLGGKPDVLLKAVKHVEKVLGQNVVGYCNGYDELRNSQELIKIINFASPDLVLVAMGNPVQEEWILRNRIRLCDAVLIGVGALFDFWANDKQRAPNFMRRLHLEWLYRLLLEPRRLLRRYTLDIFVFLRHCLVEK